MTARTMFRLPTRQALSREQRQQIIDQLLAEQVEEDREPTLDELHAAYAEAERRLSEVNTRVQAEQRPLDELERLAEQTRRTPLSGGRTAQWRTARLAEIEAKASGHRAAIADLGPEVDAAKALVDATLPGEQTYRKAVAAVLKAHNAERVRLAKELAVKHAGRLADARGEVTAARTQADAKKAAERLVPLEVRAWAAERRRQGVETEVKGR